MQYDYVNLDLGGAALGLMPAEPASADPGREPEALRNR